MRQIRRTVYQNLKLQNDDGGTQTQNVLTLIILRFKAFKDFKDYGTLH
jgi:hypothetical protein